MSNSKKNTPAEYVQNTHLEDQLAEHNTAIELIKQELRAEFLHMKESIDMLSTQFNEFRKELINQYVTKEQFYALKKDVDQNKDTWNWIIKIVGGAIIIAMMAAIGLKQ